MSKNTQQKNNSSPLLILALDFGGSATKGVYCIEQNQTASLVMEPEVLEITLDSIASEFLGATEPENAAWVNYMGETFAVGYLAKSKYYANQGLKELKYERAVAKTLAFVWAISQKLQLGKTFRLAIICLLPPGEFENRDGFHRNLQAILAGFITPTGKIQVKLTQFKCLPEGAGIYLAYQKKLGQQIKTKTIALVMVGYRNASVLISDKGIVAPDGKTSDLGMIRLLEKVVARTSGQNASQLVPAVVAAGSDISTTPLTKLLKSTNNINKRHELIQIQKAIKVARREYAAVLTSWLDQVVPRSVVSEILFCGGTADYMRRELNSHYSGTPCLWGVGADIPTQVDRSGLGSRLADVYNIFLYWEQQVNLC
ncbi:MAG: ParM/StbA family protein [Richelia sp. RM1_1_1]|nr:ParM/StbA family protein [Richelia sp. RM1_1_1]